MPPRDSLLEPVTGSALDSPAEPATGCQCLFGALRAPRTAMRTGRNGYKNHVLSRIAVQIMNQESRIEEFRLHGISIAPAGSG